MRISTYAEITRDPRARVNPGSDEPFAVIDLGRGGDIVMESLV